MTAIQDRKLGALLDDFTAGKKPALARAVSIVENHRDGFDELLGTLHARIGRGRRIGVTGPPGAGKSTLTAALVASFREAGLTVGVIAVDPTSPFTGGALLGDRIRMESVALDPGVFIRSMATRGSLGGLAEATGEVADVLDAFGTDRIIIETVGVGQSELDVSRNADSTIVVLVPESGDSIQTLKAGLMEIADIFVVNKADRPGADRLRNELELMLGLRSGEVLKNMPAHHGVQLGRPMTKQEKLAMNPARAAREAAAKTDAERWVPPVLASVAVKQEGVDAIIGASGRHFQYLAQGGELQARRRARLRRRVVEVVESKVRRRLWKDASLLAWLDEQLPHLETGARNPFEVANALLARSGDLLTGART
ncbi:MAG TPA: methylmalonyl Co-A mutase-associated GTPase MeaB [Gemmatimonadaceae bacterium]|nr:methylmalonyl Co-A mutase-associated GTPase MeaB [Gemmatimonadaceae bacterium]